MSSYHFDPHDWRDKLPNGVKFYDFGGGVYQVPALDPNGSYLTASMIALCEDPNPREKYLPGDPPGEFKVLMFKIPHAQYIKKNSDWAPIVDRMVDYWKSAK